MLWSILTVFSRLLINFGMFYLLSQSLNIHDFGQITYAITVSIILGLFIDYGYNLKLSRDAVECSNCELEEKISRLLAVKILNFILVLIIVSTLTQLSYIFIILISAQFLNSVGGTIFPIARARGLFKLETKLVFSNNILIFLTFLSFGLIDDFKLSLAFALSILIGKVYLLLNSYYYYKHKVGCKVYLTFNGVLREYEKGVSFFIHASVGFLYINVDTVMAEYYLDFESVGLYQMMMKVLVGICILNEVMVNYYLPIMTRSYKQAIKSSFRGGIARYWLNFSVIGLIASLLFFFVIHYFSPYIFSPDFNYGFMFSLIMSLVVLLRYIGIVPGMLLTIVNFQSARVFGGVLALIVLVVSSVCLVGDFGLTGVAISSLLAHVMINAVYILALKFKVRNVDFSYQKNN